jgi:hypothetical protein
MKLSEASRGTRCMVRWRQSKLGLCRGCEREVGIEAEGNLERDRQRLAKQRAKEVQPLPQRKLCAAVARTPTKIDIHIHAGGKPWLDYFVVWHGGMDGAHAMGLPLAHERGRETPESARWPGQLKGAGLRHPGAYDGDAQN